MSRKQSRPKSCAPCGRSGDAEAIRIISAQRASRRERAAYQANDCSDLPEMRRVGRSPLGKEPRQLIAIHVDAGVLDRLRKEAVGRAARPRLRRRDARGGFPSRDRDSGGIGWEAGSPASRFAAGCRGWPGVANVCRFSQLARLRLWRRLLSSAGSRRQCRRDGTRHGARRRAARKARG